MSDTKAIQINLNLETIPSVMRRGFHALILIEDETGHFVLGKKHIYPDQIYRMVGGGIDPGEDPHLAAARELEEEVNVTIKLEHLHHLKTVIAHITSPQFSTAITFTTYIFFAQLKRDTLRFDSDLDGLAYLTEAELQALIQAFLNFPPEYPLSTVDGVTFSWADYGQLYGKIHQLALTEHRQFCQRHATST